MMKENEDVPETERLERHEFDLDVEEQARLQSEAEAGVARVGQACPPEEVQTES